MTLYLTRLPAFVLAAALASPAWAQDAPPGDTEIVVTAQAQNATVIKNGGSAGVLGDKPAEDLPFSIRSYDESLILNQQPQTLGEVLDNDPTIRTTYGYGNAAEQFVIRGFPLYGDDVGLNGLYGIAPRQLIAPELFESVQVLNGATAFVNGAAPGGSGLGGSVNLLLKRAGDEPLTRATLGYTGSEHFGGSFDIARRFGLEKVVSYDMGGTTAKICLIEDFAPRTARTFEVARTYRFSKGSGMPISIPVIEMIEIGAGGGSIAWVDAMGRIQTGPESAGSEPGPACYGRGGKRPCG